jgi:hypothetical protein
MKVNEVILESSLTQTWQGVKSALTKGGSYAGGVERAKGQERINNLVNDSLPYWFKTQAAYQQRGINPTQMVPHLTQWTRKWFSSPNIPDYASQIKDFVDDDGIKKYFQLAASYYVANDLAASAAQSQPSQEQPDQQSQAQPVPAAQTNQPSATADTTSAKRWGSITRQLSGQPQQLPTTNSIFHTPTSFTAEFNKYAQNIGGATKASPALKNALKSIWNTLVGTT